MTTNRQGKAPKEAVVIWALLSNPGLSDSELAKIAGCNRASLYRMPVFVKVRALQEWIGKQSMPRGLKCSNKDSPDNGTQFEAWHEDAEHKANDDE